MSPTHTRKPLHWPRYSALASSSSGWMRQVVHALRRFLLLLCIPVVRVAVAAVSHSSFSASAHSTSTPTPNPAPVISEQLLWPIGGRDAVLRWCQREGVAAPELGFSNFCRTFTQPHCLRLTLTSEREVQSFARFVHKFNSGREAQQRLRVRVAAGQNKLAGQEVNTGSNDSGRVDYSAWSHSHALTSCTEAHVVVHLSSPAFQVVEVADAARCHVRVGPNVAIGEVEERLWHDSGLFLGTSSVSPHLTVCGLCANAGHGSGRDMPSIAGLLVAARFVLADGEVRELSRDKDADFATLFGAHLGAFGIMTSMTLQARPACKLQQELVETNFAGLLQHVEAGVFSCHEYTTVLYQPTYRHDEFAPSCTPNVQLMSGDLVPVSRPDVNNRTWGNVGRWVVSTFARMVDHFRLFEFVARHPFCIPILMRIVLWFVRRTLGVPGQQVGPFHHVTHFVTQYPWQLENMCLFIPVCTDSDISAVLNIVQDELQQQQRRKQYPLVNCMFLRLIKGTDGGLSTSQRTDGKPVTPDQRFLCLDVMSNAQIPGFTELLAALESRLVGGSVQGKPHWGKAVPARNYTQMYGPRVTEFKDAVARLTGDERWMDSSFLVNPFLRAILNESN